MKTKHEITRWTAALALGLSLTALPVSAQNANASSGSGILSHAERSANLFGKELMSSDNQKIGKVNNIIVDVESGHILYVVVNGSKGEVAVPPQLFGDTSGNTIKLNASKQQIDNAPQFTSSIKQPGELAKADFVDKVYKYFGQSEWWVGKAPASAGSFHDVHQLKDLIGMKVENVDNQPIGKVNNVVVDMPAGRIVYVVLAPDSSLNLGNNLYALPPEALTLSSDGKNLVSNIPKEKLASAPHFDKNSWPNLTDAQFASSVYQYYGKQAWFQQGGYAPTGR